MPCGYIENGACFLFFLRLCIVAEFKMVLISLLPDNASPECNLTLNCAYYMGEIAMTLRKVSCCTLRVTVLKF